MNGGWQNRGVAAGVSVALLVSCEEQTAFPLADAGCPERAVIAALSDYTTTMLGTLGPSDWDGHGSIDFGIDPALRTSSGSAYLLNRNSGIVFPLDACWRASEELGKIVVGPTKWNPQDVALTTSGSLWVPFYNVPTLRVLPRGAQDGQAGVVDLSLAEYDPDGNPNASSAVTVSVNGSEKVFVSLGRLDDDREDLLVPPKGPGLLVRYDAATQRPDLTFELTGWNPFGQIEIAGGMLLFAMAGDPYAIGETTAGIELYDPIRNVSRLLADERELGGSVSQVAVRGPCGAAIVYGPTDPVNPTELVTFLTPESPAELDTTSAQITRKVLVTEGFDLKGLAWQGDTLYVGDGRRQRVGYLVHKFERIGTCELRPAGDVVVPQKPAAFMPTSKP